MHRHIRRVGAHSECVGALGGAAIAVLLLSCDYIGRQGQPAEEFHLLVLIATFGAMAPVASNHVASFFLGLETLSISPLGLIAYPAHLIHVIRMTATHTLGD